MKEDFPTVYKAVMASMAAAKTLEAKLAPVERTVQQDAAERAQTATETVQEAIDAIPKLAHIQATNADAFELAKEFDATLRVQSAWADKPLSDRFQKVTEMVEAVLGPIDLPGQKPIAQPNAADLKSDADFSSIMVNAAKAPTKNRYFAANDATSPSDIGTNDALTLQDIDRTVAQLHESPVVMQSVKIRDDDRAWNDTLTDTQIADAVDDPYYIDLDDKAAEAALREAIKEQTESPDAAPANESPSTEQGQENGATLPKR